jgi:hypothetical protein
MTSRQEVENERKQRQLILNVVFFDQKGLITGCVSDIFSYLFAKRISTNYRGDN